MFFQLYLLSFLSPSVIALNAVRSNDSQSTGVAAACLAFEQNWTNVTYFSNDTVYTEINEDYFTSAAWLGPACIFTPANAEEVSDAIKIFNNTQTPFAIRGGGHMPISNAANINSSGVLLSSSNLSQLILSENGSSIEVGAGNVWSQVYEYLAPFELTVVGGRAGIVGVPGFVLGGGLSFLGNQYGWASANVLQFDCVLANGDIVSATPTNEYSDLFWALRGGGNSFAIVTAFHLRTFSPPEVAIGQAIYGNVLSTDYLDYVYGFAHNGSQDHKAGIEPLVQWSQGVENLTYQSIMFYDGDTASPAALINFTDVMKPINSTFEVRPSMYNWTEAADPAREALTGLRSRFNVVSIKADRQAMQIIHDTFFETIQVELADVVDAIGTVVFIPIIENYITASTVSGGDPMEVDPTQAPYIWAEETVLWSDAADDVKITDFLSAFNTNVTAQLSALDNVTSPFLYLNYADDTQFVFEGYPKNNTLRMKSIRDKYDPDMMFTNLMPGGWKVEKALTGEYEA